MEQCRLDVQAYDVYIQSSLHLAIIHRHNDLALLLRELGADQNHRSDAFEATPLHLACNYAMVDVARALVAEGADIDAADSIGRSPLHLAIVNRHTDVALHLLALGADPCPSNNGQWTPLHLACMYELMDVARALVA